MKIEIDINVKIDKDTLTTFKELLQQAEKVMAVPKDIASELSDKTFTEELSDKTFTDDDLKEDTASKNERKIEVMPGNKYCLKCNTEKSIEKFHRRAVSKDGRSSYCKDCKSEDDKKRYQNKLAEVENLKPKPKTSVYMPAVKMCAKCNIPKLNANFSKNINSKDGLQSVCKECISAYHKSRNTGDGVVKRDVAPVENERKTQELFRCYRCKKQKPLEEFGRSKVSDLRYQRKGICNQCSAEKSRDYHARTYEKPEVLPEAEAIANDVNKRKEFAKKEKTTFVNKNLVNARLKEDQHFSEIQYKFCKYSKCDKPNGKFVAGTGVAYNYFDQEMDFCCQRHKDNFMEEEFNKKHKGGVVNE